MATSTTFTWIYLGTSTVEIDSRERNANMEDASGLLNQTFGSATNPLFNHITSATTFDNGGAAGVLDTDNTVSNDTFTTNIGAGTQTFTFDGLTLYNATITYTNGTTATITAVIVQSTTGELFLAPELTANTDTTALEAMPIRSITLNSIDTSTGTNLSATRYITGFDNGIVEGTAGNDLIDSSYVEPVASGSDKIDNGDGTSSATTGWQDDVVVAGDGNDTILSGLGNDTVDAGSGNDSVNGGAGNDSILGGLGNDNLAGGTGNDTMLAGDGNDTILGDAGSDSISGGAGMDYVDYSASTAGVNINLSSGTATGGDATGDTLSGVDGIIGSSFNDTLIGFDAFSTDPVDGYTNVFYGGAGNDYMDGMGGNDSLYGGADNDTILGGAGNDLLDGGDGTDSLLGGAGTDTILGGLGADYVDGGTEADSIDGGDGNDSLFGGTGTFNDTILGGLGADTIDGGDGNDSLLGGAGIDSILGGLGADTVDGGTEADYIDGGDGSDSLFGGAGTFNDTILGGLGADTIDGGDGNDSLLGGDGNDSILGGTGNDTLNGGAGADTLIGGDGSDVFTGLTAGDVVIGSEDGSGTDQDVLDLFGSGWSFATTNILYSTPDKENGTVEFLDANGAVIGTMSFSNVESVIACFTPGTMIDTDKGPVLIERLTVGDRIRTRDHGYQTLRWIGRRDLSPSDLAAEPRLRPILIRAGAFGPAMPVRDMRLSPQHRLLLSGARAELYSGEAEVLAPVQHFLGMAGVVQDAAMAGTSYIHLLFDRHEIVRSDGIWSESFQPAAALLSGLDGAQRDEVRALFPELFTDLSPANDRHYPAARSTVKRHEARLILAS